MPPLRPFEELENLSREERLRLRVGRRKIGRCKPREKRRKLSREELLDYLRRNDFRSRRQFRDGRRKGDPLQWDFTCEFKTWTAALLEAFGKEPFPVIIDANYIIKLVAENNLWTASSFREAHQIRPDVVPSFYYVTKEFGRWETLIYCASRYDARKLFKDYLRLRRKLGRNPKAKECEEQEIDHRRLMSLFGGRRYFHQNILSMEKYYEK